HFVLAIENNITFYLALAFIIVGNGFFKPNISTFVGSLYKPGDNRKDSGFTIFYMGINIGAFVSPLLCGWLGENYGWHYGFGLAGIGMVAGLIVFWRGSKAGVFGDKGLPPTPEIIEKKKFGLPIKTLIPVISFLAVPVIAWLLSSYEYLLDGESFLGEVTIVNVLFYLVGIIILVYLAYHIIVKAKPEERGKMVVAVLLTFFMTIFWGFHELSGSVLTLFASRNVDLSVLNASQTNSLNPVFIFLLAIPFSWIWIKLDQQKLNPRTPIKFALGLLLLGIGFYVLALSKGSANGDGMVPMYFLVIMYVIISMGELCMSPVGLSKITDLSPVAIVAFMMGVWFLSSAYAFQIVGFIGKNLAIDGTESIGGLQRLEIYTDGFEYISYFAIGSGLFVLLISPLMRRWMKDVH
ncbi:MAG: oligopeptide:H+ symporter, partial [Bacteroidota bacterium]